MYRKREAPHAVAHLVDCDGCKQSYTAEERQRMGCGWEPRIPDAVTWWPRDGLDDDPPDTCIGYLMRLPEVREAARAMIHWERGTLKDRFMGEEISTALLDALEALHGSGRELEAYISKPKDK